MHTDTLIWLFPIVFMLHDFEEIIMMAPWMQKNRAELERRWPRFAPRMLAVTGSLSTPAFALAVGILFIAIAAATVAVVEFQLYALWGAMLLVFSLHFVMHIAQWLILRRYVPVIITSVPGAAYCVYSSWYLLVILRAPWGSILLSLWIVIPVFAAVFYAALRLAKSFDGWQNKYLA
ncbi:MAG: HXXEE domain-containing protein [Anaerolineaceae bacterium]